MSFRGKDLTGQRFGRLMVLAYCGKDARGNAVWICRCDCGKKKIVTGGHLGASTKSCGCARLVKTDAQRRAMTKHGRCHALEYNSWAMMLQRCENENHTSYPRYGGRGINVCARWHSFAEFFKDVGPRPSLGHSLDRFPDNDGNYEPGNVRWATRSEQMRNRRPFTPEHKAAIGATNREIARRKREQRYESACHP